MDHAFYSHREAAAYLGCHPNTLSNLNAAGTGPQCHRLGNERLSPHVYRRRDLDTWRKDRERQRLATAKAKAGDVAREREEREAAHKLLKARVTVLLWEYPLNRRNVLDLLKARGYRRLSDVPVNKHEEIFDAFMALGEELRKRERI